MFQGILRHLRMFQEVSEHGASRLSGELHGRSETPKVLQCFSEKVSQALQGVLWAFSGGLRVF